MKKIAIVALAAIVLLGIAVAGFRLGWWSRLGPGSATPVSGQPNASTPGSGTPGSTPGTVATPGSGGTPAEATGTTVPVPKFDGDVAALEWGGHVESAAGVKPNDDHLQDVIDGDTDTYWDSDDTPDPKEIVLSFYGRDTALVNAVTFVSRLAPRDIEVWTSMEGPAAGFAKAGAGTLEDKEEATLQFPPVEARYIKVRLLQNHNDKARFSLAEIKVHEAQRDGYSSLVARHPEVLGPAAQAGAATVPVQAAAMLACTASTPPQTGPESRKVLVITDRDDYPGITIKEEKEKRRTGIFTDLAIFDRVRFDVVVPKRVRPWMLSGKDAYDTVVMEQVCEEEQAPDTQLPASFKRALVAWVGEGHKLIIHDADKCSNGPDYSWLPYRLKTNNPGPHGAPSDIMQFLEENSMAHGRPGRPGFIDLEAWLTDRDEYRNEIGDTNTVTEWDPHWCGHMAVQNINNVFGFSQIYAHYGRGLIIYGGYDVDMAGTTGYDLLIARELAVGFNPDNLPCSARLGEFVITTDTRMVERDVVPGRTYVYPLKILSNQGYKGTVNLSLTASPGLQGLTHRFQPASVAVTQQGQASLTVTLPAGVKPAPLAVEVKGTDSAGKSNSLCLRFVPPTMGELVVVSDLGGKRPNNLEIVLDVSGSMKTPLGKKTRWSTALDVLHGMLAKLPDDYNVGLRLYGHRESSRSPRTCSDSELVVPIEQIDREAILTAARAVKPKGETPLVYSVLQAPADLKAAGGGTVIVITDGEESCKGDMAKAAAALKASGEDIRLNIVGFTLTGQKAQAQLAGFAESTGGRFYPAATGEALGQALMIAAIEKFPYSVFDASGKQVTSSEAGAGVEKLPPGIYKVVVQAGEQTVVADRVEVALGGQTILHIVMKDGRLALQR